MKIIKKDEKSAEKEREKKELALKESEAKESFLKELKNSEQFKKYVLEGIIKKNIELLSDNRNLKRDKIFNAPGEEVKQLLFGTMVARETLEKIFSEIMN